jgi:hypothetical protein
MIIPAKAGNLTFLNRLISGIAMGIKRPALTNALPILIAMSFPPADLLGRAGWSRSSPQFMETGHA